MNAWCLGPPDIYSLSLVPAASLHLSVPFLCTARAAVRQAQLWLWGGGYGLIT